MLRPATGVPWATSAQKSGGGSKESVRARPAGCPTGLPGFGLPVAALDDFVADAVAGVDRVFAAVAVEAVDAGLAEHRVGAAVADQHVVVEGALDVLVGRREADVLAACDRRRSRRRGRRARRRGSPGAPGSRRRRRRRGRARRPARRPRSRRRRRAGRRPRRRRDRSGRAGRRSGRRRRRRRRDGRCRCRTRSGRPPGRRGSCRRPRRRRCGRSRPPASEPSTRRLSFPGPRSAISQRAGPLATQTTWVGEPPGRVQPSPIAIPLAAVTPKVCEAAS